MNKRTENPSPATRIYEILLWSGLLISFLLTLGSFLQSLRSLDM
jgi:hypothetical protein